MAYPTSSAIFGRVGVVAQFDPTDWLVFDAVDPKNQDLYLSWAWRQPLYPRMSMLTIGSAFANDELRNKFRSEFEIDCVLFPPDQTNDRYTKPTDVWMCVTASRAKRVLIPAAERSRTIPRWRPRSLDDTPVPAVSPTG